MTTPDHLAPFLGVWASQPGQPLTVHTLLVDGPQLRVHARWQHEGAPHQVDLWVPLDGSPVALQGGLQLRLTAQPDALTTQVHDAEGLLLATATRRIDADALVIHHEQRGPGGALQHHDEHLTRARVKQVICYRRDLNMRKGKIAAQCAHGSLNAVLGRNPTRKGHLHAAIDGPTQWWFQRGTAKIVLSVEGEAELDLIATLANQAGLPHAVITDAGHTEFHGVPTRTVIALGPAADPEIDAITGPTGAVATKLA